MSEMNPELDAQFDELADLCCQMLNGGSSQDQARCEQLLKSMLMSGYTRKQISFQSELERRVKTHCPDQAMHRGGALSSLSGKLEQKFIELARWESSSPRDDVNADQSPVDDPHP